MTLNDCKFCTDSNNQKSSLCDVIVIVAKEVNKVHVDVLLHNYILPFFVFFFFHTYIPTTPANSHIKKSIIATLPKTEPTITATLTPSAARRNME